MRILYLIDEIVIKGGTEKHLWDLANGMSERGHQVTVVSLLDGPFGKAFQQSRKLDYICLGVHRIYGFKGIMGFFKLVSIIRRSHAEIVQTFHTASDLIGPLASFLSRGGIITISSRRDLGYTKAPKHVLAQRLVNSLVDRILSNSIEVQEQVFRKEGVSSSRATIIYNGIETQAYSNIWQEHPDAFAKLGRGAANGFYIGTVANLRMVKGIQVLLRAAKILEKKHPSMFFLVAGDGVDRKRLEALAEEYEVSAKVSFVGWLEDVPNFLSSLDIYVQPSLTEGFSNSILEAMAAGLPVIATAVGGNKEIISHQKDGLLVEPDDSEAIARSIEFLYDDQQKRIEIAKAGRTKVFISYTLSYMLDQYESFYYSCLRTS